jgi:hypothetical protein
MKEVLIPIGALAIAFALAMLWLKGETEKDKSLKTIAVVAGVAFLVLALLLAGGSSGD